MQILVAAYNTSSSGALLQIWSPDTTTYSSGTRYESFSKTYGFCPVFLLNDDVKIESGDGLTAETAYVLTK